MTTKQLQRLQQYRRREQRLIERLARRDGGAYDSLLCRWIEWDRNGVKWTCNTFQPPWRVMVQGIESWGPAKC